MPSPELPAEEALQRRAGLRDQRPLPGRAELLGEPETARLLVIEGVAASVIGGAGSERLPAELGTPLHRQRLYRGRSGQGWSRGGTGDTSPPAAPGQRALRSGMVQRGNWGHLSTGSAWTEGAQVRDRSRGGTEGHRQRLYKGRSGQGQVQRGNWGPPAAPV